MGVINFINSQILGVHVEARVQLLGSGCSQCNIPVHVHIPVSVSYSTSCRIACAVLLVGMWMEM